jgi:dihydrofolate reductase
MAKLRVHNFAISLDGYGAGPDQGPDNPPYHHPVFVLTHHPRPPIPMEGGTAFRFVAGGIEAALEQAFEAAGGADVRLGGGVSTIQQYLRAGLVDELHLVVVPVLRPGRTALRQPGRRAPRLRMRGVRLRVLGRPRAVRPGA